MRLSKYNSLYKNQFLFLKFMAEKDHIDSLQCGNLRCGTGKIYREYERKQGEKGIGDKNEASVVVIPEKVNIYHSDTEDLFLEGIAEQVTFSSDVISQLPVFSLYGLSGDDLEVFREDDESYYVRTVFDEEDKILLQKEFGKHVLIIHASFLEKVIQRMQEQGIVVIYGFVQYDDFSKMSMRRLTSYKENEVNVLFWKDEINFKHQKEYRMVLDTQITDYTTYGIGDIRDITIHMTSEKLFTEGFRFRVAKI